MKEIGKVLDRGETVLWEGGPSFWPFLFGGSMVTLIFGLFWMAFLVPFIALALFDIFFGSRIFGFGILLLPHFWVGILLVFGIPLYQVLVHKHTWYAITDKRVIFQKGLVGRDFEIVDHDRIGSSEVNVGIFDKLFGGSTGSIIVSAASGATGGIKPRIIRNIADPYAIFRLLKQVSHDVKTDIEFPNRLRPPDNPGYSSVYNPGNKPF